MEIRLLCIAFLLLIVGAIDAAATSGSKRGWISLAFVSASSICLLYLAIHVFVRGTIGTVALLSLHPVIGASLSIGIDPLSALLLFIISIISF
jgi:NADH:ubiquinone oxidoreductase subunit 5 (subunit L)/multisubunit Na+/H+ antiporter MnhA subunit